MDTLKISQALYMAISTTLIELGYGDRNRVKHKTQDMLNNIVDSRVISWLVDDLIDRKPSNLDEIIARREADTKKKLEYANKVRGYNQPTPPTVTPSKTKKKSHSHDDR